MTATCMLGVEENWVPDNAQEVCSGCDGPFKKTLFSSGVHHCRHCGDVFCEACSSNKADVPACYSHAFSWAEPQRVCDGCYDYGLALQSVKDLGALSFLSAGTALWRHQEKKSLLSRGKKEFFFSLAADSATLVWKTKGEADVGTASASADRSFLIDGSVAVERGRKTAVLLKQTKESRCCFQSMTACFKSQPPFRF